jgi:sulfite exporter TauE/SafE
MNQKTLNPVNELTYGAALMLGLLGGGHCLVMCGGIGASLGLASDERHRYRTVLLFQLGRIGSYTLLGAGLGALLGLVGESARGILPILRILSAVLLVAMGCYLAGWWQGLLQLEKSGQIIWRKVQPLAARLLPIKRARDAVLVGACWGFLPCGLIYTALAYSATAANSLHSAALMFCFGLGTLPVLFASGVAGQQLVASLRKKALRISAAVLLIGFGLWTGGSVLLPMISGNTAQHEHHH